MAAALAAGAAPAQAIQCGKELTRDTTLKQDLNCPGFTGGLKITEKNGITLDLNGHTIVGDNELAVAGIKVENVRNTTIKGGTVRAFDWDVYGDEAEDLTVRDMKLKGSGDQSVRLNAVVGALITDNVMSNAATDTHVLAFGNSEDVTVTENRLKEAGINLASGFSLEALDNTITDPAGVGIALDVVAGVLVRDNEISGGEQDGIYVNAPAQEGIRIQSNRVEDVDLDGIFVAAGAQTVKLTENVVSGAEFNGISTAAGTDAALRRNRTNTNGADGIHVEDTDNLIQDNVANANGDDGIDSLSSNGSGNQASGNGDVDCAPVGICG